MGKITLVSCPGEFMQSDWEALYIDGKLVVQADSFTPEEILKYCGIKFDSFKVDLGDADMYPENLAETKKLRVKE